MTEETEYLKSLIEDQRDQIKELSSIVRQLTSTVEALDRKVKDDVRRLATVEKWMDSKFEATTRAINQCIVGRI